MLEGIDEKLITWDEILGEIKVNSSNLIEDLLEGIKYIAAAGILLICLGSYVLFNGLRYGNISDPAYVLMLVMAPGSNFVLGLYNLYKYFQLRSMYRRLFDLQTQLKK